MHRGQWFKAIATEYCAQQHLILEVTQYKHNFDVDTVVSDRFHTFGSIAQKVTTSSKLRFLVDLSSAVGSLGASKTYPEYRRDMH